MQLPLLWINLSGLEIQRNELWPQNLLRQTYNVFVFTFIKHLFKWVDVLHIKCVVEK